MKAKYKILLKDSVVFAIGNLSSKFILFLLVPLYTNYLSTGEFGTADLVLNLASLFSITFSICLHHSILRFSMERDRSKEDVLVTAFLVQGVAMLFPIMLYPVIGLYAPVRELRVYMLGQMALTVISDSEMAYLKANGYNKIYSLVGVLRTVALALVNILFLRVVHFGLRGYLLANIISSIIAVVAPLFLSPLVGAFRKGRFIKSLCVQMVKYSSPFIISTTCWWSLQFADRYIVQKYLGEDVLGIYSVAAKMIALVNIFISIFYQAWGLSSIREAEGDNDQKYYSNICNWYIALMLGVGIVLVGITRPFMKIYVGTEFLDAAQYTPILLTGSVFYGISAFFSTLYQAYKKSMASVIPVMICSAFDILMCIILIPLCGLWGACIAYLMSYLCYVVYLMVDTRRLVKFDRQNVKWIIGSCLLMIEMISVSVDKYALRLFVTVLIFYFILNIDVFSQLIKGIKNNR